MKRKVGIFLVIITSLTLACFGCPSSGGKGSGVDPMADIGAAKQPAVSEQGNKIHTNGINNFSLALFKESAKNEGNIMISPASVYLALAMTLNGADGETKDAMLKLLAEKGLTVEMLNRSCSSWLALLDETDNKTTLEIANSIWLDKEFVPDQQFLKENKKYYGSDIQKLDFKDPSAPDLINKWVKKATHNTIQEIVESIHPNVVMYLINAIYFHSDWQTPFENRDTYEREFHTPKKVVKTPFLHRTDKMIYISMDQAAGVALPYVDTNFAYFALLPDGELSPREWLSGQDQTFFEKLNESMSAKSKCSVQLCMPKFEAEYSDSLIDELTSLGMGIAFEPYKADFSLMNKSHQKNLFISEVKHKTFICVDEKGTEASGATSVEIREESAPLSDQQLTLDRPFLYGIMDIKSGLPLFVGIMENPETRI